MWRRANRFLRTPKGLLTLILALLIAIAAPGQGIGQMARGLGAAILALTVPYRYLPIYQR